MLFLLTRPAKFRKNSISGIFTVDANQVRGYVAEIKRQAVDFCAQYLRAFRV